MDEQQEQAEGQQPEITILETERLLFRYHEEVDLDPYCQMMADPEFRRLCGGPPLARQEAEESFRNVLRWRQPLGLLATIYKPEGRYIGRCGLYAHRTDDNVIIPKEAVLAFYLARPYWGRGLATEAGRAFIEYGFGPLGLTRIVAGANTENLVSNRVLQKLGFVRVATGEGGENTWHDYELCNPARDEQRNETVR